MNVFIEGDNTQGYFWFCCKQDQPVQYYQGSLDDLAAFYDDAKQIAKSRFFYIVSALECLAKTIEFSPKERKHIQKAIPYLLEESVLTDVEDLHIVNGKLEASSIEIMALDSQRFEELLAPLIEKGIECEQCFAQYAMLETAAEQSASWQLLFHREQFLLKSHSGKVFAIEAENMPLVCQVLSEDFSDIPQRIVLYISAEDIQSNNTQELAERAKAYIPEALQHVLDIEEVDYAQQWQQRVGSLSQWNLFKGKFAKTLQWQTMLLPWRWVLVFSLILFIAYSALMVLKNQQLDADIAAKRAQIQQVARTVIPQGKIVDPVKQLKRELDKLSQGGSSQRVIDLINTVGKVLAEYSVKDLSGMNYEANTNSLYLDLLVANYDTMQKMMNKINDQGLKAELQNSNAQDDKLRVRLKIKGTQ